MVRIIYNGLERSDFIYYLSCILATRSTRVIVNDCSTKHDLFSSASKHSDDNIYEWRNIIFTKDLDEAGSNFDENDILIEYRGETVYDTAVRCDECFHLIMPDYTYTGVELIKALEVVGQPIYILRDMCTKKVTDKSLALDCGLENDAIVGHIEFSCEDLASYVAFTHNGLQKFDKCSEDMKDALTYVSGVILNISKEKDISKVLKNALKKIK